MPRVFLTVSFIWVFFTGDGYAGNLDTCLSGKYPALCNKNLLTSEQKVRVRNAEKLAQNNPRRFRTGTSSKPVRSGTYKNGKKISD
jgi:hypothetical protein